MLFYPGLESSISWLWCFSTSRNWIDNWSISDMSQNFPKELSFPFPLGRIKHFDSFVWCFFHKFFSDVGLILENTNVWQGKAIEDVTVEEYTGLMNSHVLNLNGTLMNETFIGENSLKNCSLVEYLNDAASGTGLAFIGEKNIYFWLVQ